MIAYIKAKLKKSEIFTNIELGSNPADSNRFRSHIGKYYKNVGK